MNRFLSFSLSALILCQSVPLSFASDKVSPLSRVESLQGLINNFKHEVYGKGVSPQRSIEKLTDQILSQKFQVSDLQLFVQLNSSPEEFKNFEKVLNVALSGVDDLSKLSPTEFSFILEKAMVSTTQTGANFMSCDVGLGIGVPLIAVGVIIGIIALANATASEEIVVKRYIELRSKTTSDYLNLKADLELELTTYESDIIYYRNEMAELERHISSGLYSPTQIEQMRREIHEFNFLISDANALIGEVMVDLNYFNAKYDSDITIINQKEVSEIGRVDEKKVNASKFAIAAGISTAIGSIFVFSGVSDCN